MFMSNNTHHIHQRLIDMPAGPQPPVRGPVLAEAAAHLNDATRAAKRAQRDCSDLYLLLALHRCFLPRVVITLSAWVGLMPVTWRNGYNPEAAQVRPPVELAASLKPGC